MTNIKKILLVGTGLIGGSLALNIKEEFPEMIIYGLDNNQESLKLALQSGVISKIALNFEETVQEVQMVILCTPVKQAMSYLQRLANVPLTQPILVTDVGSTKMEIMLMAKSLKNPLVTFIGGHPMAGSHKTGFIAADRNLFENAYFILTSADEGQERELAQLRELYRGTRGKFIYLTAPEHDEMVAVVSHLPHIIAASLVNQQQGFAKEYPLVNQLAAGGFRDITRIASSSPLMWRDILMSNRHPLIKQLEDWQGEMSKIRTFLETGNEEEIFSFFLKAKEQRDSLPKRKAGALASFNDLLVEVPDYAGQIAKITTILAEANLSLTNLKIIENREDIYGTLQLTFKYAGDVMIAKEHLETIGGYRCHEK